MSDTLATEDPVLHNPQTSTEAEDSALTIAEVVVDDHCIAHCWTPGSTAMLARLVAIIAMGQAAHAARIITGLAPAEPRLDHAALREAAKVSLSLAGETEQQRDALRAHRDGFIFESISWIAAQQSTNGAALLRDPHIKATTQGLDGLMLERNEEGEISQATIFEDKCTTNPRAKFRDEILPAFKAHHENKRAPEILAASAALLEKAGLDGTAATAAAERVLNLAYRAYRGSVTIMTVDDTPEQRKALFKGYGGLEGLAKERRIGGTFVTPAPLRDWFEGLAGQAIAYIDTLEAVEGDV